MYTKQPARTTPPVRYGIPLFLSLIAAGLVGNYLKFPLFLNIDFLFGSIFAMLVLQFFGIKRGLMAAAIIAAYTCLIYNHPCAFIIMTVEVAVVGWLVARRRMDLVIADSIYWLIIGMPLVYLFYHFVLHIPPIDACIVMTNLAINGIANTLVARLIFTGYALKSRTSLISYREIICNILAFLVLCPALIMMAVEGRTDFAEIGRQIHGALIHESQDEAKLLQTWALNRKTAILNLANMAASKSTQQMQDSLEQAKISDPNFLRIGLLDREATCIAFFPALDELGQNNIGNNFADRPYIPKLKETLKPMLSEVVTGRVGTPGPIVSMLAPVVMDGKYGGYIIGVLELEQVREILNNSSDHISTPYTLIDKNGNVIMSNRADQKVMTPFKRGEGTLNRIDEKAGISQLTPPLPHNTRLLERWNKSSYIAETDIGDLLEWKLILEQPVAPFQQNFYNEYSIKLALLLLILFVALALAEWLSRKFLSALELLRRLTNELPVRLTNDFSEIVWPDSGILEAKHLINNFREMADSLSKQLTETVQINETLEQRVAERTEELQRAHHALQVHQIELELQNKELRQVEGDLGVIRERYFSLYDLAPMGYLALDEHGGIMDANLAAAAMLAVVRNELFKKKFTLFILPDDQDIYYVHRRRVFELDELQQWEMRLLSADGSIFWAHLQATPTQKGEYWIAFIDITERKLMEAELHRAKAAADAASSTKSKFLATMSHEIRTPLSSILGNVELLNGTSLTPHQKEYLSDCKSASRMLLQVINDVLDLSKIEAGKLELNNSNFSITRMSRQLVRMFSLAAQEQGLELNLLLADDLPEYISADEQRLRQIITNLLSNAIKFTRKGTVSLEISCETLVLHIAVRDTGIGIPLDKQEEIFNSFTQVENFTTRRAGGTGLGLMICRHLLSMMGGSITVTSAPEEGTLFEILLPVIVCPAEDQEEVKLQVQVKEQLNVKVSPRNILLADDEKFGREVTQKLLQRRGYRVTVAESGIALLDELQKNKFEIVLTDISMPGMDGTEAVRIIRSGIIACIDPHIPVIAMTAHAFSDERDRYLATGFSAHIAKPIDLEELYRQIEELCGATEKEF